MSSVCRICLAGNTNLNFLESKQLLCCFENLTNAKFNSDDARPRALCSFCYQKLLRCHTFSQMALTSEKILSHLYERGLEVTHEYITEVNIKHRLSVVTTRFNIIDDNATNAGSQLTIKDEPLPTYIDVKEEVTSEPDELLKVVSFPEDRCQIQFEEDISDQGNDTEEFLFQNHTDQFKLDNSSFTFKDEPLPSIDIKKDLTTELYRLTENEPFPDHSTKNRLTFEEDYSDQEKNAEELLYKTHVEQIKPDDSKKRLICNNCDKIFYIKRKLISHVRNWHSQFKGKQYSRKKHTSITNMIQYKAIQIQKIQLACHVCDEQFYYTGHLVSHMRTHKGEKPFVCNVCHKKFNRKHNLDRHMRIHDMEGKPFLFACNECEKQFNVKHNIVRHMRIHMGLKLFVCNVCDKQFHQKGGLVLHMRHHSDEKPFACNVCDKQFTRKQGLVFHMRTHTGEKPFTCNECEKQFNLKQTMLRHMRIHMGIKLFSCSVCDKRFYRKGELVLHTRIHTGEKPFACNKCDKKFHRKQHLDRHMRIHDLKTSNVEKPFLFACNECEKQFHLKQSIVRHMRIHMGLKLFACNVCDKQFHQKGDLVVHMRYHSGEKPFACNVCDKKYNRKHRLVLHMRIHTGEKSFNCNHCEKQYYLKQNLVRHMKTHMRKKLFA